MIRLVRKEFARHPINTTLMIITANHGVVRIQGTLKIMRGHEMDLEAAVERIALNLRGKEGIRDILVDCTFRA